MVNNRLCLPLVLLAALALTAFKSSAGEDKDYNYAQHYYRLQEYQLAVEAFTKYLQDYPKSERADQARLLLGESFYQLKDFAKAAEQFDRFTTDFPASARRPDALQRAVRANWQVKNYAKALGAAATYLKENLPHLGKPDAPPALGANVESVLYYAGDSAYSLKQFEQARAYWAQLEKEFPQSALLPDASEGLGWIAFEAGNFEEALKNFSLTAKTPNHALAASSQIMAARALDKLNQPDQALAALDQAATLTGAKEQARQLALFRPVFLLRLKRYPEALSAYHALVQNFAADPDTPISVCQATLQLEEQAKTAEALELTNLYLASFPKGADRPGLARVKARLLTALKRDAEALSAAQAAVKEAEALPPGSAEYQQQRPAALLLCGEMSGAGGQAAFESIVKDHAGSKFALTARYELAYLAGQAGQYAVGLTHAETLLKELPPGDKETAELHRKTLYAAADFAFRLDKREVTENYLKVYCALPAVLADPAGNQLGVALLREAWCRQQASDPAGAIPLLDQALALNPAGELRAETLYLRGLCHLQTAAGDLSADPMADYTVLLKEMPDCNFSEFACYDAALGLSKTQHPEASLPWLDKMIQNPAFAASALRPDGLLLRAKVRQAAGKSAEALADLEALLKLPALKKEQTPTALFLKGLCLEATGATDQADAAYSASIQSAPASAPEARLGLFYRGKLRFNAHAFQTAQADFTAYLAGQTLKPEDEKCLEAATWLALCLKELKDPGGAQAHLEKLAALNLTGTLAFEVPDQLGNLAYEAGKNPEAAEYYHKALAAAATAKDVPLTAVSAAWMNLGWAHKRAGEAQKAEAAFGELIRLDPAGPLSAEARHQRARLLADLGNVDGAVALWKELLEKQAAAPVAEKALLALAQVQAQAERFAAAKESFAQYLKLYPSGSEAREAQCGIGECLARLNQDDDARGAFLKALGDKGLDADLDEVGERGVLGLAELELNKKEFGNAKKLALRVIIDRPDSKYLDTALLLCGQCSEDLKEPNQAIGYYRNLLSARPQSERVGTARERLKALGVQ